MGKHKLLLLKLVNSDKNPETFGEFGRSSIKIDRLFLF